MSALPIVLSGTTDAGTRYVQFWDEKAKIVGREAPYCYAAMSDGELNADWLRIARDCPLAWVERVLELFPGFLRGVEVPATHTVTWKLGDPTFHPIERPVEGDLFDLLDIEEGNAA
jgi:hypothetical protein